MPSTRRYYRLRIAASDAVWADFSDPATATGNALVVTSARSATNPYIAEPPDGDGQELDPITGKATIGEMHVRVIDALVGDADGFVIEDTFQDSAAEINARWPMSYQDVTYYPDWSTSSSPDDGTQAARLQISTDIGPDEQGIYSWSHTYTAADGIEASAWYVVRERWQMTGFVDSDTESALTAEGTTSASYALTEDGVVTMLVLVQSTADAELTVGGYIDTNGAGLAFIRTLYRDNLRIYAVGDYPGRIVTKELADADGYWHLLSRWAAVEVSEDAETWTTLRLGFLNNLSLADALVWDFTVGETRRAELRAELYRECPTPVNADGVLISPTCLVGGPIVSGAVYNTPETAFATVRDHGPARFEVISQSGHSTRQLDLDLVGAWMAPFWKELRTAFGDGNNDVELSYPNHYAREFFEWDDVTWAYDGGQDSSCYGWFPGIVAELTRVSDGVTFYTHPLAIATRRSSSYLLKPNTNDPVGTYDNLLEINVPLRVDWDAATMGEAKPSAGEQFDVRLWPLRPSATFPIHEAGHPVDLVLHHADAFGLRIDTDSATAAEAAIDTKYGGAVTVELIHEGHLSFEKYHTELLSFFGYALRPNVLGELEFVGLRYSVPTDATAITLDLLRGPEDGGSIFTLGEDSIVTTAEQKTRKLLVTIARDGDDVEASLGDFPPDLLQKAWHTATGATDDTVDAGDQRTHTWTLPGRVLVDGVPLAPDPMAQAAGDWLVNWKRRGVPTMEVHVLPDVTADVGDEVSVDLPHLPVAVAGAYPVTDRGQAAVTYRVTRRTETPDGAELALIKAPPAVQATIAAPSGAAPTGPEGVDVEFTLTADPANPSRVAIVTLTNGSDFTGSGLSIIWQYGFGATEPTRATLLVYGVTDPATAAAGFPLPSAPAGETVWVRGSAYEAGARSRINYSAWDSLTLSTLAVTPTGAWDSGTAYQPNQTVTYGGETWIAKRANTNVTPVAGDDWALWDSTAGALALDDLTDVTISSPANGQVLKYNGTAWVNGTDSTGSGGGGSSSGPDEPPTNPSAEDDDWSTAQSGAGLIPSGWTGVNWSGLAVCDVDTTKPDALFTENTNTGSGTGTQRYLLKALPAGDFTIVTSLDIGARHLTPSGNSWFAGLALTDGTTAGAGSQFIVTLLTGSSSQDRFTARYSNFAGSATTISNTPSNHTDRYLRIRRSGTNYYAGWSPDNRTWFETAAFTLPFTPAYMGFCQRNDATQYPLRLSHGAFRYAASATAVFGWGVP